MKLFTVLGITVLLLYGCQSDNSDRERAVQEKVYKMSRELGDPGGALNAAYNILALDSTQTQYYDTIAQLHFALNNFPGAYKASLKALGGGRQSLMAKELAATSAKRMGQYTDAAMRYQELIKDDIKNAVRYQYNVGECFFLMENYEGALNFMNQVASNADSRVIDIDIVTERGVQKVPYYLAALNTMGYIMIVKKEFDQAQKVYDEILQKKPDFELAQNNSRLLITLRDSSAVTP